MESGPTLAIGMAKPRSNGFILRFSASRIAHPRQKRREKKKNPKPSTTEPFKSVVQVEARRPIVIPEVMANAANIAHKRTARLTKRFGSETCNPEVDIKEIQCVHRSFRW